MSDVTHQFEPPKSSNLKWARSLPALYNILANVDELRAYREQVVEDGALPDELAAIDKSIDDILSAEVVGKKADGICNTVHAWETLLAEAQALEMRATARRKHWEDRIAYLKERTLHAMQAHSVTRIETATNRLRVQNNGGIQPLETKLELLPGDLITTTLRMTRMAYALACAMWDIEEVSTVISEEPNNTAIRAALSTPVVCPECDGERVHLGNVVDSSICPRCDGKGTIPATVAGARLLPRGTHLRLE